MRSSSTKSEALVEAIDVSKSYSVDGREIVVVKGVSLQLSVGETVAVVGPSGAGKSTLLHLIGLLETPSDGSLHFNGYNVRDNSEQQRAQLRLEQIGFVFQFHHLMPEFTALENVMLPGYMAGNKRSECDQRAATLLDQVGLANRVKHKPGELSGGEQQRVALARALMNKPRLLMADEPTGNLDRKSSDRLRGLLWDICLSQGTTLLLVTHDETLSAKADRTLRMVDGRLHN
jgi:lipoprotein-releasing system ATP-binding protein